MKAVIMAGGRGTRLKDIAKDIPKPMVRLLEKPILEYQIENLRENGIKDIIIVTGYLGDCIKEYFGDGNRWGVNISYFTEDTPLGTGGSLYYLREKLCEAFILIMGDLLVSVDFERFAAAHKESGALVSLFVHPNSHPWDSDIILTDSIARTEDFTEDKCGAGGYGPTYDFGLSGGRVTGVSGKKDERKDPVHNLVNAGIYCIGPGALEDVPAPDKKPDLDRDIIRPLIAKGRVYAYRSTEYVKDMGTPERFREAEDDLKKGIPYLKNLRNRQSCIFMDRDGTLNVSSRFINDPGDLELLPGAAEAVRRINASGRLAVVITNQPVIARGGCSLETLDLINRKLETELGREGAYLDGIIFCPHHPDSGFEGEIKELKFACTCRKPGTGMFETAKKLLNADLSSSWMIGDMTMDLGSGKNAGMKTCLVMTGLAGRDGKYTAEPDIVKKDILEAVLCIAEKV